MFRQPLALRQPDRAFQQRVDEGLGQVAAELAPADVELLGEEEEGALGGCREVDYGCHGQP